MFIACRTSGDAADGTRAPIHLFGVAVLVLMAACGDAAAPVTPAPTTAAPAVTVVPSAVGSTSTSAGCADVIAVDVERSADGTYAFDVTVASADAGNDKYADAWEVRSVDGRVLGTRVLAHPHVNEQPFTRSLRGVELPADAGEVVVAARDTVAGFCGATVTVAVPGG